MNNLKLSATSDSLSSIFKDWQIKALATIPNKGQSPIGSKEVWERTNEDLREEFSDVSLSISRASVINFLDYLHKQDLLWGTLGTGKGGKRYRFTFNVDRGYFNF